MTKLLMRRAPMGLQFTDTEGKDALGKIAMDELVSVRLATSRNPQFHRLYMGLLRKVHENLPEDMEWRFPSFDGFRSEILNTLGYCDVTFAPDGSEKKHAKSLAFDNMEGTEFRQLYEDTVTLILKILPGWNRDELMAEVLDMVA